MSLSGKESAQPASSGKAAEPSANGQAPQAATETDRDRQAKSTMPVNGGNSQDGPLAGVRILDLTRLYPGPLATMLMAEMGAEVIKVEDVIRPDPIRFYPPFVGPDSAAYLAVNRSKRSLSLKLNEETGQEIFFRLVKRADIVIEQFRPGVLDELGLGYVEAIKSNPRIIYLSLSGYGQNGPYSGKAGHDLNFIGYSGLLALSRDGLGNPVIPGVQIADIAGGAYMAVIAALSALWARNNSGVGQRVDVSMLDAVMPLMSLQLARYWAGGEDEQAAAEPLTGGLACYGVYRCADGKFLVVGALEPKFWKQFCEILDRPQWGSRQFSQGREAQAFKEELAALFLTKTRRQWMSLFGEADVCVSPLLDLEELESDPQLRERGVFLEQEHPELGMLKGIANPLKFSRSRTGAEHPAPALGEHSEAILQELGYTHNQIREMLRKNIVFSTRRHRRGD